MRKAITLILTLLMLSTTSCVVVEVKKKDNGNHKGWYKNPNNPHNPNTTKVHPSNSKGQGSGKVKKK